MKLSFFTNYMNHHQLPFSMAVQKRIGDSYVFVATEVIEPERLALGYRDMNKEYPFILMAYDSRKNKRTARKLALESDVIITGSALERYTRMRIKKGLLTFRYSERLTLL